MITSIDAIILDLDGTLTRGSRPMPGLRAFFAFLAVRNIAFVVATNNTVKTPQHYAGKLAEFGVAIGSEQVITAAIATADYLTARFEPGANLFVIGETGLRSALQEAGFTLISGMERQAAAVVVGGDRALTYEKLRSAIRHLLHGARFIGANPDLLVPTEQGLAPEAGTTLAALQAAAGIAPTIIGKPERPLLELALARMQAAPESAAILGDRLDTDILGGQRLGLTTIFITSGVNAEEDIAARGVHPDHIVHELDQVIDLWEDQA